MPNSFFSVFRLMRRKHEKPPSTFAHFHRSRQSPVSPDSHPALVYVSLPLRRPWYRPPSGTEALPQLRRRDHLLRSHGELRRHPRGVPRTPFVARRTSRRVSLAGGGDVPEEGVECVVVGDVLLMSSPKWSSRTALI